MLLSSLVVNRALRANNEENSKSPIPSLSYFWHDAKKPIIYEREQWAQLFEVAELDRHSILMTELLREANQQSLRMAVLMGNLQE